MNNGRIFCRLALCALAPLIVLSGCASQADLTARDNYIAAAQRAYLAAKSGDRRALGTACQNYNHAAKLEVKIADSDAAFLACEAAGNAGDSYSSYLMGNMLYYTTPGFFRSADYVRRYSTRLDEIEAAGQWYRKAEHQGFAAASKNAIEAEAYVAKTRGPKSDTFGKVAAGLFVAGVASAANIPSGAKAQVMGAVASDLASNGSGTATSQLLAQQQASGGNQTSKSTGGQVQRNPSNTTSARQVAAPPAEQSWKACGPDKLCEAGDGYTAFCKGPARPGAEMCKSECIMSSGVVYHDTRLSKDRAYIPSSERCVPGCTVVNSC